MDISRHKRLAADLTRLASKENVAQAAWALSNSAPYPLVESLLARLRSAEEVREVLLSASLEHAEQLRHESARADRAEAVIKALQDDPVDWNHGSEALDTLMEYGKSE
jgi:hypothetical protein